MRVTRLRLTALMACTVIILLNTGCVYVRLYEMKKQFSTFAANFELRDEHGIVLVFKNPMLLKKDLVWLTKNPPDVVEKRDGLEVWTYVYKKHYQDPPTMKHENGDFDIPLVLTFSDGRLQTLKLPERFLQLVSRELMATVFESLGSADVNKLSRTASSKFRGKGTKPVATLPQVVSMLGKPIHEDVSKATTELTYHYSVLNGSRGRFSKKSDIEMEFGFHSGSKRLLAVDFSIRGLNMSIDFSPKR